MNKNLIHIGPILVAGMGVYWSSLINPGATLKYNIAFGLAITLIPILLSFFLAGMHRGVTKKKIVGEVAEGQEPSIKKTSYWYYFSLYCTLLGLILYSIFFLTRE